MSGFAPTPGHPTVIPLSQLESLIGGDGGEAMHLEAVMAPPSEDVPGPSTPAQISPPLNRPDNEWVRFEAEVRSKHAVALVRLRQLGSEMSILHSRQWLRSMLTWQRCSVVHCFSQLFIRVDGKGNFLVFFSFSFSLRISEFVVAGNGRIQFRFCGKTS